MTQQKFPLIYFMHAKIGINPQESESKASLKTNFPYSTNQKHHKHKKEGKRKQNCQMTKMYL
jgi:hypothetical protein